MADIMEDMDPDVLSFIKQHVRSFVRWDVLRFLYENPGTWDTAENLAVYVGRGPEQVRGEIGQMACEGLLRQDGRGPGPTFGLTENSQTLQLLERLVSASQDRTFRMKLVYHILRAGGEK
ncbi:MAG: hypothetical protein ACOYZ7_13135 [Chloroflexota bacterium]